MPPIVVPVGATTADIPRKPGLYILHFKFNEGIESVRLNLDLGSIHGTKFFLSCIVSKPQGPGIPDNVLDRRLNEIHDSVFGSGGWVNLSRRRHQVEDSQYQVEDSQHQVEDSQHQVEDSQYQVEDSQHQVEDSQYQVEDSQHQVEDSQHQVEDSQHQVEDSQHQVEDSQHQVEDSQHQVEDSQHQVEDSQHDNSEQGENEIAEQDAQLERSEAKLLQERLRQLRQATGKKKAPFIRKESRALATEFKKTRFKDSRARAIVQDLQRQRRTVSCLALIVDACEHGMADLSKPAQNLPSTQLADLFVYQKTRDGDHGERLSELLVKQFLEVSELKKDAEVKCKRKTFEATTLAENASIVHRFHTGLDSEWLFKYKERRSMAFNKILNNLYGFMGADAWGLSASLHATGSVIGEICEIHSERIDKFITDTAWALRDHKFADLSDETPVFIYPAWLAWLLGYSYRDICRALGLEYLADEDPGVCDKLDELSLKYSDLSLNSEDHSKRAQLEKEARKAVTVPLGHLREIHKRRGRRDCLCSHHISSTTEPRGISVERAPASGRDLYARVVIHSAHEHETPQLGVLPPMGEEGLENHDSMPMVTPNATAQSPSAPLMALATAAETALPPDLTASATSGSASEPCDPTRPGHTDGAVQAGPDLFQDFAQVPHFTTGDSHGHENMQAACNPLDGQRGGFMSRTSESNQQRATEMCVDRNEFTGYSFPDQKLSDALGNTDVESWVLDSFDFDGDGNFVQY